MHVVKESSLHPLEEPETSSDAGPDLPLMPMLLVWLKMQLTKEIIAIYIAWDLYLLSCTAARSARGQSDTSHSELNRRNHAWTSQRNWRKSTRTPKTVNDLTWKITLKKNNKRIRVRILTQPNHGWKEALSKDTARNSRRNEARVPILHWLL